VSPFTVVATVLIVVGAGFVVAGSVGVLRFGDARSRLHAVTKADNLGLGLVVAGLAIPDGSPIVAIKLLLIWVLAMLASTTAAYLIAHHVLRTGRHD
jgi:multicomponent Na+:H+ antiporter subunit G